MVSTPPTPSTPAPSSPLPIQQQQLPQSNLTRSAQQQANGINVISSSREDRPSSHAAAAPAPAPSSQQRQQPTLMDVNQVDGYRSSPAQQHRPLDGSMEDRMGISPSWRATAAMDLHEGSLLLQTAVVVLTLVTLSLAEVSSQSLMHELRLLRADVADLRELINLLTQSLVPPTVRMNINGRTVTYRCESHHQHHQHHQQQQEEQL